MIIINPAELQSDKQLRKIVNLEQDILRLAKLGLETAEIRGTMMTETYEFLRLTHPILKHK